ncbi:type IV secretory system conjugative DNA transfer family protein [Mycobacterium sp. ZZG]
MELLALRRTSECHVAMLRQSIPVDLAGIIAEVPGAELEFGMSCSADGIVTLDLTAEAGSATGKVVSELEAVLQAIAETAVRQQDQEPSVVRWPLVADARRAPLGFTADGSDSGPAKQLALSAPKAELDDVLQVLAGLPGEGLRTRITATDVGAGRWEAQMAAVTTSGAPSLRLRAALRRRFPGLQVADSPDVAPVRLQVATSDLARVLTIPVAGALSPAGVPMGPAAAIPLTPTRPDSSDPAGHTLRIGYGVTTGRQPSPVALTLAERLRHVHVLGRTGTGKSSVLASIAHEVASSGEGAFIADPHGTLCDRILAELPDSARDRVWMIRCGDVENPVPINSLAESDSSSRDIAIDEICESFQYLFDKAATGIVGPRFRERVAMTLRAIAAVHGTRTSILDVPVALADNKFMADAVAESKDVRVQAWWRNDQITRRSNEYGDLVSWVNSKFEGLASTAAMRAILGSGADAIDFGKAMDDGRIILADLSKAQLGEPASRLLGYLYLNRIWTAALRRTCPERPFTVIVDEAHSLISGSLTNMLAEGRKFGLSVVLAHQYLEQLDANLRPAVDGNVGTTIAFRCAAGDSVEIQRRFGGLVDPTVLMTMPDLSAVTLRTATEGNSSPHTLVVDHNTRVPTRTGEELAAHTEAVMTSTRIELADPYRDVTAGAAKGLSNVTAIIRERTVADLPFQRRRPPPPTPKKLSHPSTDGVAESFLDEWLAAREEADRDSA